MTFDIKNPTETGIVRDEHGKPCRSCMDFRSWMKMQKSVKKQDATSNQKDSKKQTKGLDESGAFDGFNIAAEEEYNGRRRIKQYSNAKTTNTTEDSEEVNSSWGKGAKYGCPSDTVVLGNGSWQLLHSMAAYYPDKPSDSVQKDMKDFIGLFSKLYPCFPCAKDFREWIHENPPLVDSKWNLSKWFCGAHNDVNRKLGKPLFDCNLVTQRWSEGWKDGSCD